MKHLIEQFIYNDSQFGNDLRNKLIEGDVAWTMYKFKLNLEDATKFKEIATKLQSKP